MKSGILMLLSGMASLVLSSCFLVSVPVKATGEIIEKSAYATRDLSARGIRELREPAEPNPEPYKDPAIHGTYDYGGDASYEGGR